MTSKRFFFDFYQCHTISTDTNAGVNSPEAVFQKFLSHTAKAETKLYVK